MNVTAKTRSGLGHTAVSGYFSSLLTAHSALFTFFFPLFPASGPATGSFNGLHPESNFLAIAFGWDHRFLSGIRRASSVSSNPLGKRGKESIS